MKDSLSSKQILLVCCCVVLILTLGRLFSAGFDPSYFIVAGSDFTGHTPAAAPIIVQHGQGYDGQFFYRSALAPGDFTADKYGIHLDHPAYRVQRIAYPFLSWLLALGGTPALVPFALLLVNILAFLGIAVYASKIAAFFKAEPFYGLYPLLLCGIYMSIARDLSEVCELCFFTGALYYLFTSRYLLFSVFATVTMLSRETSMIAFLPLSALLLLQSARGGTFKPSNLLYLFAPFAIFAAWKYTIYTQIPSVADATAGYGSLGIPFKGLISGFRENLNFSSTYGILPFTFWIIYIAWQLWFVSIIFRKISFKGLLRPQNDNLLKIVYLTWLLMAICFTDNIYGDDWGFVRIFSMWNMVGFLLLMGERKKTGKFFNYCSGIIVIATIVRLIIRV
jgi:hypothetical protein